MRELLKLGNQYAKESTWKDFALTKLCLFSIGIIVGTLLPEMIKKTAIVFSVLIFLATYIPLMAKVFRIARRKD